MKRIIFLTEIISPYRIPVFNNLDELLNGNFMVIFFGASEKRRHWKISRQNIKFHYEVLPYILFQKKGGEPYFFNPTILYKLMRYSPDIIIIGGYHHPSSLLALCYVKLFKKRLILWCESNKYDYRFRFSLIDSYKRWFIKNCSGYAVSGKSSFDYLVSLGADFKKICTAPNAVDNDFFAEQASKHKAGKEAFKQEKGYPQKVILYIGRIIERKGVFDLLMAFQALSEKRADTGLVLVGSGEEENNYKDFCVKHNLRNVFFKGFIQQEELPRYYAAADVFVLPSRSEPWGLVLNEAMASGLPVISSDVAGAAADLVIHGENGYVFKKGDIKGLAAYIDDILSDEQKRNRMGQRSLEIIKNYSSFQCAQGFARAVKGDVRDLRNI